MSAKPSLKAGTVFVITMSVIIGALASFYVLRTKTVTETGAARFYYLITDNGEVNYSLENSKGVIVTQLHDDSIRLVQEDGRAYMFRNDTLLETADISPFKLMQTVKKGMADGSLQGAEVEVLHDNSELLKLEIEGIKEIRSFYNLVSPTYSDTQVVILNNMLKARGTNEVALEFEMLSTPDELVYMLVNYRIGSSVFNIWKVEGRYVREIGDWSLGFDWSDKDILNMPEEELSEHIEMLVQVVNDVMKSNFDVTQPTVKEE